MASWDVVDFQIHTVVPESAPAIVNADGKMHVFVYVSLKANIKGTSDRYFLTEDELQAIELVDFHTDHQLPEGWSYSGTDLSNVPPETLALSVSDKDQLKCYRVTSTTTEDKKIAARIRQPDGRTVSTQLGTEISFATLAETTTTTVQVSPHVAICQPAYIT
ncbi:predicted protein [Aspergillus terreus NIH2624]|uniref:Uncharacterized protein n=1 Tax=Aspergillus terreus (strain NIH 2624 / FGSC A1156) TaxID=341663 RepID=Q0CYM6_ASPTN|nr:uncharacterized protein ATEG_01208 [Aspergillus terreus NIH2624]EAU37965.1 predicted protein [Aspergillus terreus NIH2624]